MMHISHFHLFIWYAGQGNYKQYSETLGTTSEVTRPRLVGLKVQLLLSHQQFPTFISA